MLANFNQSFLAAAFAGAILAGTAQAAPTVSELAVSPSRPTQISISLTGKSVADVRDEVRTVARTVCRNAALNNELETSDVRWCRYKSATKALRRYDAILAGAQQRAALPATLVLSSR